MNNYSYLVFTYANSFCNVSLNQILSIDNVEKYMCLYQKIIHNTIDLLPKLKKRYNFNRLLLINKLCDYHLLFIHYIYKQIK